MKAAPSRSRCGCRSGLFSKPMARALIEQRRNLALDAETKPQVLTALDALTIAPEVVQYRGFGLSRPALDLLAIEPREIRRFAARRGGAAVGHGGPARGRQHFRRRSGLARGAGSAAAGAGARCERRGDQEAHRRIARRARQVPAGAGRGNAEESADGAADGSECAQSALAGSEEHDRPARAACALRRQGSRAAAAAGIAADAGKSADGAARASRMARTATT